MVTLADIQQARAHMTSVVRHTPLLYSDTFTHIVGSPIYLKAENLQRTGSFKVRGAFTRLAQLTAEERAAGVIAASAGNHAQGVALAAQMHGVRATIVMPETASIAKYQATIGYGAKVVRHGASYDEALSHAHELAEKQGLVFISGFDDERIVAGAGTLGLELVDDLPEVELVLVPTGGGGLLSGVAVAVKSLLPNAQVVGVQVTAAPAAYRSFHGNRRVKVPVKPTLADGIAIGQPGEIPLRLMRKYVDDVVMVDEESISRALVVVLERSKLLVEPAGAVGLAALMSKKVEPKGKKTAVVLSGGNLDVALLDRLVGHGLALAGRYLVLNLRLSDRPGELARLLDHLATLKVNVLDVETHREGITLPVGQGEVRLVLETQDASHGDKVRESLRALGYREGAGK